MRGLKMAILVRIWRQERTVICSLIVEWNVLIIRFSRPVNDLGRLLYCVLLEGNSPQG
jgi:hypothetical protein